MSCWVEWARRTGKRRWNAPLPLSSHGTLGPLSSLFIFSVEEASLLPVYVGTANNITQAGVGGEYFVPFVRSRRPQGAFASDRGLQEAVWEFTEKLLKDSGFDDYERL